jgi:multidrug transporter EmrE-like cation transporter
VPYVLGLAHAYRHGEFSLAYPVARGGGALLAAIGGIVLLGDDLRAVAVVAILVVVGGMALLAVGAPRRQVATASFVAATIGCYTLVDSHAAREYGGAAYVLAAFAMMGLLLTVVGVAGGHAASLLRVGGEAWRRSALAAAMSLTTYGLVLVAVGSAPVGYVAALRESSVVIAAIVGWRVLGERRGRVRLVAAAVIVTGLVLLVTAA